MRVRSLLVALAVVLMGSVPAPSSSVAPGDRTPQIADTGVVHAPTGEKGGLMNPVVWCTNHREPRVRTVVEGIDNDFRRVWRYRGSLPGLYFPRVEVGRYRLTTRGVCGQKTATRVEVVKVRQKVARTTVSRSEWQQVDRGMTRGEVRRIIGYDGTGSRRGRVMHRSYDMMPFWSVSVVKFRDGRVVAKYWDLDHD